MPGTGVEGLQRVPPYPWRLHRGRSWCKEPGGAPEGVPQPLSPPSPSAGPAAWPGTDPRRGVAKPAGGIARAGAAPAPGRVWPPPWARAGCWPGSGTTAPRRWWCSAWRWPFPTGTCGDPGTVAPVTPCSTHHAAPSPVLWGRGNSPGTPTGSAGGRTAASEPCESTERTPTPQQGCAIPVDPCATRWQGDTKLCPATSLHLQRNKCCHYPRNKDTKKLVFLDDTHHSVMAGGTLPRTSPAAARGTGGDTLQGTGQGSGATRGLQPCWDQHRLGGGGGMCTPQGR